VMTAPWRGSRELRARLARYFESHNRDLFTWLREGIRPVMNPLGAEGI
jgi:hypothetical protein